jgi:alpha-galactosidase
MKFPAIAGVVLLLSLAVPTVLADDTVWLSSLDLSRATQGWGKPQADRSVEGRPLMLNGRTFAHGFGTHAPGMLIVDLGGGTKRLNAAVGIDDETAGKGSAEFQVLGDGNKILWRSGVMHPGEAPKALDLDLTGVKQIVLRVTDGGDGFEFDHADWADAQFMVTGGRPRTVAYQPTEPVIDMALAPVKPHIQGPSLVGIRPGTPFLWTIPVSGRRPLTYSVQGLPKGLTLNPATGTITGSGPKTGDYPLRVQARNVAGRDERLIHIVAGDKIALTPPMGWNSYDAFGDSVTESEVLANARYVAANMQPFGWDTIVVDYRWYDPGAHDNNANARAGAVLTLDANGRLLPSPNRFPSAVGGQGFKPLADQIHAMGLKFGIHIMRGIPRNAVKADLPLDGSDFKAADAADTASTCPWCPDMYGVRGDTPAGQAYYDSLFRLYASWGLDFVKVDDMSRPYHTSEIEAVRRAIDKCGRTIVLSLSPGATPVEQAAHVAGHANMWREADDFWDNWQALDNEFGLADRWQSVVGPGHWPDADMLPVGHLSVAQRSVGPDRQTRFSQNEQLTLLSFWALLPAPLMVGANLPDNDPWTRALLTNPEVLAVDQDAGGTAAKRIARRGSGEVWARPLAGGSVVVGLFNRSDFDDTLTLPWSDLKLTGRYRIRDLWQHKSLGIFDQSIAMSVPGHGTVLLLFQRMTVP